MGVAASPDGGAPTEESPDGTEAKELRTRLVAVRHGTTAWSLTRRHTGRSDIPLEPEGLSQGIELGRRLGGHDFAIVLTSPLERARMTCELAGFGSAAQLSDDLVEWDYGEMEGRTTEEIRAARPGWDLWTDGVDGGETLAQVSSRADKVIDEVRSQQGDVLVFAHAHILRVLAVRWVGLEPELGRMFSLAPATISILDWERETPVVARWNDNVGDPLF
jgi:broad specificity phosphatase PhoE